MAISRVKVLSVVAALALLTVAVPHSNSFLILLTTRALAF